MLSIENQPADPSSSNCLLNTSTNCSDERASPNPTKLPSLPEALVVDLPNPPPHHHHHHTPLSNFSIRDYVFKARSKDIKKNWPFSHKNLQLCLKHGVKDVLPPFQPLDTVRNQSFRRCTGETSSLEKQNISTESNFAKEPSGPDDHAVLDSSDDAQLNNKLAESCADISSCRSGKDHDFPSPTTSEIDSVPDNRQQPIRSPLHTRALDKASVEVEVPATHKTESASRPLAKKCRLIVKFGGNSDRSSTEDIASNCTTISETMASKVCPVCKTFSSSSNTTLNAHIDQCLSVESTPKWTGDSKLTRYRIKPRKTRLMVDIYATAQYCTLEELDQRNGTNWATISGLPSQETEKNDTSNEGKKQRVSLVHPEDASDVGPVYIDANGTKVRILSQFRDQSPASKVREDVGAKREDIGARKSLKGGKASKYIPKEKKKHLVHKHQKYLKLASQSQNKNSHKPAVSQISGGLEENNEQGHSLQNEHQMPKQIEHGECGTFRPWVCSKRRGFLKKSASQEGHQPVRCKWHLPQDLLVENDQPILGVQLSERSHVRKSIILSDSPISSPRNSERMEKPYHKDLDNETREHSPGRKAVGNLLVGCRISGKVDKLCPPMKGNANQLSKDGTSIRDARMLRPPNASRNNVLSLKKKTVYTHDDASNNYVSSTASTKSSRSSRSVVAKAMRFSSFRKTVLSVSSHSFETEPRPSKVKKWSTRGHSPVHFRTERDEEAVPRNSNVDEQFSLMQDHTKDILEREEIADEVSLGDARQGGGLSHSSEREESFRSSKSAPRYCHGEGINIDSLVTVGDDFRLKVDCQKPAGTQSPIHEHVAAEPSSNALNARSATSFSKPVHAQFYERGVPSNVQSSCLRSIEDYRGLLSRSEIAAGPTEPGFVLDQEMFSTDEADNNTMGQNTDMGMELDSDTGPGDSFPEVDPIPIPGPPGSFLPSPRDMGSEDFQGNSSLTTSRVYSSTDQHEMVDGDSSDSPLSAASTISNSTAARSDFNCVEPSSLARPYAVQDKIGSGLMSIAIEPLAQNAGAVPQASTAGVEKTTFDGEYIKLDRISIEKGSFGFRNDQPCCCQRKERFSQGVALNHQESQLLRRRKMASISVPPVGKQLGFNSNPRPINLDVRCEPVSTSNHPTSGSEKMVRPVFKPLEDAVPLKDSPDTGERLLAHAGFDSASPSASNPILRLMGKNLMVVNKDDDPPIPLGQVQPCTPSGHQGSQFSTMSVLSPGDIQNQDSHSLHHMVPQGSVIFGRDPYGTGSRCIDVQLSNSFGSRTDLKLPRAPAQLPAGMFHNQHKDGRFSASVESLECKDDYDYNLSSQQNRPKRRLNMFPTYTMQKATETSDRQCKHGDSAAQPVKEIIVIDDVPESQTVVIGSDLTRCSEGRRERQVVSAGISIPTVSMYNSSNVHPVACYQSQDHPSLGGSPVVHNGSFHPNATRLVNMGPVAWGCTSEGPAMLQRSPYMPTASQSGHLRSAALYYSPSFS